MSMPTQDLDAIHQLSFGNEQLLGQSAQAGCFQCLNVFPAAEVSSWVPDKPVRTAVCPRCGIDSVLGDSMGMDISSHLLEALHNRYFSRDGDQPVVFDSFAQLLDDYQQRKSKKP